MHASSDGFLGANSMFIIETFNNMASILFLLFLTTFMQDIYSYVPETNHVSSLYFCGYSVVIDYGTYNVIFSVLNVLYFYIITFQIVCAVPSMAVFCSSLMSSFLRYLAPIFSE